MHLWKVHVPIEPFSMMRTMMRSKNLMSEARLGGDNRYRKYLDDDYPWSEKLLGNSSSLRTPEEEEERIRNKESRSREMRKMLARINVFFLPISCILIGSAIQPLQLTSCITYSCCYLGCWCFLVDLMRGSSLLLGSISEVFCRRSSKGCKS